MKTLLSLLLIVILSSCATGKFSEQEIKQTKTATDYEMIKYGNLYIGGQPKSVDFIKLRQEGFVAVVNFRKHKEDKKEKYNEKWERNNSLLSGMSYYSMGWHPKEDDLTKSFVNKLPGVLKEELEKGKVLLHCQSGNRAAVWVAANAYLNQNATKEQARELALKLGAKDKALNKLDQFLK